MQTLFEIQLEHEYFSDNNFQHAQLMIEPGTRKILDRFGLVSDSKGSNFNLYTLCHSGIQEFVSYLELILEGKPLVFWLAYDPAKFFFITDLPMNWSGQLEYNSSDLSNNIRENKYRVSSGVNKLNGKLSERSVYKSNVIGVVKIYPSDLLEKGGVDVKYTISFMARMRHWQYIVVNKSQVKIKSLVIKSDNGIQFEPPQQITSNEGGEAWLFSSGEKKFPMEQIPTTKLNLVNQIRPIVENNDEAIENELLTGLPIPKDEQLNVKLIDNQEYVYSDVYVYL